MNLSLARIEVAAFRNIADKVEVPLAGLGPGLYYVRGVNRHNPRLGPNGVGKSSLFAEAPTWCLYGTTATGLRTSDIRSWGTKEAPVVTVALERGGRRCLVTRGPRAGDIAVNGEVRGQEDVSALVGLTHDAWCQAVVWGQGAPLFFDLQPAAKMTLLSDTFGLERWERRAKAAAVRAGRLEERLTRLTGEVRGLTTAREHAAAALEAARVAADEWAKTRAARLKTLNAAADEARAAAEAAEGRRDLASLAADSAGTAVKLLRPDVASGRTKRDEARAEARAAGAEVKTLTGALVRAEDEHAAFSGSRAVCPTCGQPVTAKTAKTHSREAEKSVADLKRRLRAAESLAKDWTREAEKRDKQLEDDETRLREHEERYERASVELRLYGRDASAARAKYDALTAERTAAEADVNPHRDAVAAARTRLREVEAAVAEKEGLAARCADSAERASFWARGFRDIRLGIIDEVLGDLRETTAEVLEGLGLGEWAVEYTTERETKSGTTQRALHVSLRSPEAPEGVRWEVYSGGERQRLRVAGALALSEVLLARAGLAADFRVFDEPTRGLSAEGVRDLCEVLEEYARAVGVRIFYVDHQAQEGLAFAASIEVARDRDGVRVSMG